MHNILVIDCATEYLSLGLQAKDKSIYSLEKVINKHSDYIIPQIKSLLTKQDLKIEDLHAIAYNQGPGSFTGLRIGLSVALGLAYGLDIKLIPIPSFAIIANSSTKKTLVAIDARLNQVYFAGLNADKTYFIKPQLISPSELYYVDGCELAGNGFEVYKSVLDQALLPHIPLTDSYPNALHILKLIKSRLYQAIPYSKADLLYLRNKVAIDLVEQKKSQLIK